MSLGGTPLRLPLDDSLSSTRLTFFFVFGLFRTTPTACGGSQVRGQIGAVAASLHYS